MSGLVIILTSSKHLQVFKHPFDRLLDSEMEWVGSRPSSLLTSFEVFLRLPGESQVLLLPFHSARTSISRIIRFPNVPN